MTTFETEANRIERMALRVIQAGAIAVVMAVTTLHAFDLDRFFVPKELALHVTAALAGLLALRALWRMGVTRVDLLLCGFLLLSALSALMATNRWLAMRALAVSASSVILFWVARALRGSGLARHLIGALALAVVIAAATSLLQAYGLHIELFSETRSPGGTLGNRNFIAHAAAFGFPLLLLCTLRARHRGTYLRWALATAFVVVALVLTRSRAAWLAFAAVMVVVLVAMLFSPPLRRDGQTWRRLAGIALLAAGAVALSLFLPNALHWHGSNPYLESVKGVADYSAGSGRGRLVQYGRSLLMAVRHPLFGVGPGNWPVDYPAHVPPGDPSLDQTNDGMTSNPWPSSDWVACIAERGVAAFVLFALVFLRLAGAGLRQLRRAVDAQEGLAAAALLGIVAGAVVAGTFDAVLLLAVPAFLVWAALGALWVPEEGPPRPVWKLAFLAVLALSIAGIVRSTEQLTAMEIYAAHSDRASLVRAAGIDPGNFRLRLRLARLGGRARCENARAARALFPSARAAVDASRGCGK
ncbi:MAG TPA: O-antigen ligase family protein [Thermoanaerobaculia bacterium]|jgi:O-antigen ligase|nr:O-antigen ligase family protein [Thermoanaerobaculia bacterium]